MQQIQIGTDKDAGKIIAFLISRDTLRSSYESFHYWMNVVVSDSQCNFASSLFNRNGLLKQRLYGTFGSETDQDNILYIRSIVLKKEYRNQKLGCKALRKFLQIVCMDPERPFEDDWWLAGVRQYAHDSSRVLLHTDFSTLTSFVRWRALLQ